MSAKTAGAIYCQEAKDLLTKLGQCIHEITLLSSQQFKAVVSGDPDSGRFDDLIHMATQRKHAAKYAYMEHLTTHGCSTYGNITAPEPTEYDGSPS